MITTGLPTEPELFAPLERELMIAEIDACAADLAHVWPDIPDRAKGSFMNLEKSISAFRRRCIGDQSAARIDKLTPPPPTKD